MINTNDIGKQFFSACMGTGFGRIVTLRAIDTVGAVLMANVFDANMPNPSNIPGMGSYWLNADKLIAAQS
jgi:hypothetical protein